MGLYRFRPINNNPTSFSNWLQAQANKTHNQIIGETKFAFFTFRVIITVSFRFHVNVSEIYFINLCSNARL